MLEPLAPFSPSPDKKIAVFLPGIGYNCDRPLLYYSQKLAQHYGWETVRVPYGGFPDKVRGDAKKMEQCARMALEQTRELLGGLDFGQYNQILFVSKSVGTVTAAAYAHLLGLPVRHILYTPVEATFAHPMESAIAFHGTRDPWADTETIKKLCADQGIPLYLTEGANHSLETGVVSQDLKNLEAVMARAEEQFRRAQTAP